MTLTRYLAAVFVDTDVSVGDDETVIVVEVIHSYSNGCLHRDDKILSTFLYTSNFQPEYLQTAQEIEVDLETVGEVSLPQLL